jgi:hypothetical protein
MCRMPILTVKFLILTFLLAAGGGAQAQDPADPAPVAAVETRAEKLLDRAIEFQGGDRFRKPGAVRNLTVRMNCHLYNYNKQPPERMSIEVSRYMQLTPQEKFRSEWKTAVDHIIRGFDGKRYWYTDKELNRFLVGDDFVTDREEIDDTIAETKYLLRLFFLANLKGDKVQLKYEREEKVKVGQREIDCDLIRRDNLAEGSTEPTLMVWLGKEDGRLVKASALATRAGQKTLTFVFHYLKAPLDRIEGVLLPFRIEVFEQPFGAPKDRISLRATFLEEGGIEFNTEMDAKLFRKPPRR